MRTISTEITIDATPEEVWAVLTDFPGYADWNPFIREAAGEAAVGTTLDLRMYPESGRPMAFRPKVLVAEPTRELRWIGHLLLPGIFDGEHFFRLTLAPGNKTTIEHGEHFRGILVPFLGKILKGTARSFAAMNDALRGRIETARTSS